MKKLSFKRRIAVGLQLGALAFMAIICAYNFYLVRNPPSETFRDNGYTFMVMLVFSIIALPAVISALRTFEGHGVASSIVAVIPATFFAAFFVYEAIRQHVTWIQIASYWTNYHRIIIKDMLIFCTIFATLLSAAILNFVSWRKTRLTNGARPQ